MTHSRRDALKLLGAGAALSSAPWTQATSTLITPELKYFSLRDVRLGDGPFLSAQKLDEAYLLRLEPDRMLANFRANAGLQPRAPVYGGWESVEPWIEIRCHGHTAGHYLTATACMYETTGDQRFAERVDYMVAELAECQAKTGGWLTAFPDGAAPLTDSLAGKEFAGVPWYTTHKVLAGLRDAHLHRGSQQALKVWIQFSDWIDRACAGTPEDAFQKMLDREHGGMNEVLADLYAITRDPRFAQLAQRFCHQALLRPLADGVDKLDGLHANTQIPKVIGFNRVDELLGPGSYGEAAEFFWRTVVGQRSFATGGHGDVEHFFPRDKFAEHLGSAKTMETCCTHNMMRLTRALHARDPRVSYFDYFERALFNGILASQDPESGMNSYFQATRPGYVRLYHTPFDSFWCCTGSGIENHARYGESIYAYNDSTLSVNLFLSSTLNWAARGIELSQQTRFPDVDSTRLVFKQAAGQSLTVALRQPSWCPVMTVSVNGRESRASRPGEYFRLRRRFRRGDVVELRLPMALSIEPLPKDPSHVALMFGPIVLAARLGKQGLTPGSQVIINERQSGEMLDDRVAIPKWPRPLAELPAALARDPGEWLSFTARGFAGGEPVSFVPYFRTTNERYNLYWQSTPS